MEVDNILSSVRELEKEKKDKEKILLGLCSQRKQLQEKLKNATSQHITISAQWSKSQERVKIAEQKALEYQCQVKHYESINQDKRLIIEELNTNITEEERKQQEQLTTFEQRISELTDKFRSAINFYSVQSLEQEIKVSEDRKWTLTDQVKLNHYKLQKINEEFECIKRKQELQKEKQIEANEIDDKTRTVVLDMCQDSVESYQQLLDVSQVKKQELLKQLKELKIQLNQMTTKLQEILREE